MLCKVSAIYLGLKALLLLLFCKISAAVPMFSRAQYNCCANFRFAISKRREMVLIV
jgi:hypothetical protein